MLLFFQVGQNQPLPVQIQIVRAAQGIKHKSASPLAGLQQQMYFCIVTQRLKVPHALNRSGDGFLVHHITRAKGYLQFEPVPDLPLQDLQLHLAHKLHVELPQTLVPHNVQLGIFLLQLAQPAQRLRKITVSWQEHLISQHRLQHRGLRHGLGPQSLSGKCVFKAGDGADTACVHLLRQLVFGTGIDAQLVGLFCPLPHISAAGKQGFHTERTAGDLQTGQPRALVVPGNLIDPGAEDIRVAWHAGQTVQVLQQLRNTIQSECRAETARKKPAAGNGIGHGLIRQGLLFQIEIQQALVTQGNRFVSLGVGLTQVDAFVTQPLLQLPHQSGPVRTGQVHFIDKQKCGDPVPPQQPPQCFRVALDAVAAADDQNGIIQDLQRPLHLR